MGMPSLSDSRATAAAGTFRLSRNLRTNSSSAGASMKNLISSARPISGKPRSCYLAAFGRALPGLSPEELWFRMRGILAVVAVDRVEVYNQRTPASVSPVAAEAARRWAISFLAAAMSAPPTGT
jgi:hypothetical protein